MRIPTFIFLIIFSTFALTLAWWAWADAKARVLPGRRGWRIAVAGFALLFLAGLAGYIGTRAAGYPWTPPGWWVALVMLWALLGLPLVAVPLMLGAALWWLVNQARRRVRTVPPPLPGEPMLTRRQALAATVALAPMVLTVGTTAGALLQNRRFRVRRLAVDLPDLPAALEGMTIAHVSDTHVGKFTHGAILDRIANATTALKADLTLFTGDLIDSRLDELPEGIDFLARIGRDGRLAAIEGNHDLFGGREPFEQGVRSAGQPLLLDETRTFRVRGRPVQIFGLRWGADAADPSPAPLRRLAAARDPDAFPILLSHHPHAFDRAAEHGFPLTLAGHTHGGQLMLTPEFGAGPMLFRYWSGLYRRDRARLVVSNGAGNWFPLRTYAPAEIIHLTLRRG